MARKLKSGLGTCSQCRFDEGRIDAAVDVRPTIFLWQSRILFCHYTLRQFANDQTSVSAAPVLWLDPILLKYLSFRQSPSAVQQR